MSLVLVRDFEVILPFLPSAAERIALGTEIDPFVTSNRALFADRAILPSLPTKKKAVVIDPSLDRMIVGQEMSITKTGLIQIAASVGRGW